MNSKCVHEIFEERAAICPDRLALTDGNRGVTFAELNSQANQLALRLRSLGVGPESVVGVCLPRTIDCIRSVLAVLKAGSAYVPIDPSYPEDRLQQILIDTQPAILIATSHVRDKSPFRHLRMLCLDTSATGIAQESDSLIRSGVRPDNLAYVTYTSGSTGRPKAILAVHRSITNGVERAIFSGDSGDEMCCLNTPISFAFSASRIFLPLMLGVPLRIVSEREAQDPELFAKVVESSGITRAGVVTPFLRQLLTPMLVPRLARLRSITIGGAPLTDDLLESFTTFLPQTQLLNGYAASEVGGAIVVSTFQTSGKGGARGKTMSRSSYVFPNTTVYIVNEDLQLQAPGCSGEIAVTASHLGRGYLGQPGLTANRFVPNPFGDGSGERLYRTGDIGRLLSDGHLEILGRNDDQVKIRGYRVELGEVESILRSYPGLQDVAVCARSLNKDASLIGYVIPKADAKVRLSDLRAFLHQRLPDYMVPSAFFAVSDFPCTANGKVDKTHLPSPEGLRPMLDAEYVEPRTAREAAIASIWATVLGLDRVGVIDNFLELGGDSIQAVQIRARIRERLGLDISLQSFLERPTITDLMNTVPS